LTGPPWSEGSKRGGNQEGEMGKTLFVGNLSFSTSDAELKEHFSKVGNCESASVLSDRATGRSRGFGFVEMSTDDEAVRAISQLDGSDLQGRNINVSEAREKTDRGMGGGAPRFSGAPPRFGGGHSPAGGGEGIPRFQKDGGSRRGLRAKKRSL
jgi:RNA recognition motif-containing protein